MEKYFSFFFSKKKVVQLLLVLCHLFDSLLPTDFISDIQNVKKKKTVLQKDQKAIHDKVVIAQ